MYWGWSWGLWGVWAGPGDEGGMQGGAVGWWGRETMQWWDSGMVGDGTMRWWDSGMAGWWDGGQGAHVQPPRCPYRLGDEREERKGRLGQQSSLPALPWGSPQLSLSKK